MKAVVYDKFGLTGVLEVREIEKPLPRDNEVLIKVYAASINSWDWDLLRGKPFLTRLDGGLLKPKYNILGADVSGQIEAIGNKVKHLQIGNEVFGDLSGCGWGGFGEYVCADENVLALKPAHMPFDEAASIPQAAVLALQGLRYGGEIQKGQKVLINGAGGGVGTFAIQMAKSFGAEVTAVDRAEKRDIMLSAGADHVIDYILENVIEYGQRYDLILDVMATRSIFDYMRILDSKGTYVLIGGATARILQFALLGPLVSRITDRKIGILVHKPDKQDLNVINKLYESGSIKPMIDKQFPLHEVADALRYYGDGRTRGKIVITMEQ